MRNLVRRGAIGPLVVGLAMATAACSDRLTGKQFANWAHVNGELNAQAYSPLDQIDSASIERLGLEWSLDLPGETMLEATPLAVDGMLYFTGGRSKLYAVDAVTGKLLWSYEPEVWKHDPQKMQLTLPVNRGVAYADGRVFFATVDGRLIALDAKSGELAWSVATTPANPYQSITGAPRVVQGQGHHRPGRCRPARARLCHSL